MSRYAAFKVFFSIEFLWSENCYRFRSPNRLPGCSSFRRGSRCRERNVNFYGICLLALTYHFGIYCCLQVGGTEDGFRRAENILRCMGKNIVHCGPAGNGQVAKVVMFSL